MNLDTCYGQLAHDERPKAELDEAFRLNPNVKGDPLRFLRMWSRSPEALRHRVDGIRKAGIEIPDPAGRIRAFVSSGVRNCSHRM